MWEEGRWLDDGTAVLVPSGLVRLDERSRLCQATSNGLAAGRSFDQAATAALLELLERDALLAHWLARRPGRPLAGEPGVVVLDAAIAVPVVACVALGDGRASPAVAVALPAARSSRRPSTTPRREAAAVGAVLTDALRQRYPTPPAAAVRTPLEHGLLRLRRGQPAVGFLLEGQEAASDAIAPGPNTLAGLVTALPAAGLRPAAVELGAPHGWHVVRALVPGLQPLWFGSRYQRTVTPPESAGGPRAGPPRAPSARLRLPSGPPWGVGVLQVVSRVARWGMVGYGGHMHRGRGMNAHPHEAMGAACSLASTSSDWTTRTASRFPQSCVTSSQTAWSAPAASTAASSSTLEPSGMRR